MKSYLPSIASAAAVIVGAAAALAQWPSYHTPGPRTPDGKIDMTAPAPKTADGHTDFSGVWAAGGGGGGGAGRGRGAAKGKGPAPGTENAKGPAAAPAPAAASDSPPLATFFNIGQNIPGGAPMTPWAQKVYNDRKTENSKDNPDAHCLPLGYMQLHLHPQPRKIIQTPSLMVILYEAQAGVRQIFLDGRPLPKNDPQPWWYGYSIGHWDGDALVVESTGFRDDVWLDVNGTPLTNTGKITERFRRPNFGTLQIDITIEDPKAFTKPFTVRVNQRLMPDTELIEFICNENEKSDAHLVGK